MIETVEERKEQCSIATKLVTIKLVRRKEENSLAEGEIVGFQCDNDSSNCESRCTYKMLLEDF